MHCSNNFFQGKEATDLKNQQQYNKNGSLEQWSLTNCREVEVGKNDDKRTTKCNTLYSYLQYTLNKAWAKHSALQMTSYYHFIINLPMLV